MEKFNSINYLGNELLISNLGRVFKDGKELRLRENPDGYYVVSLMCNGKSRSVRVNRLVAMAFVHNDDPDTKVEVNHIDFNRKNNESDNLEWCSHADNIKHSFNYGRYPKRYGDKNPNFGNHTLSKRYKDNPELAKEKQSRPGVSNGRSRKTDLYYNGKYIKTFDYYKLCCEYVAEKLKLKSIPMLMDNLNKAAKNNTTYKGYSIVKH